MIIKVYSLSIRFYLLIKLFLNLYFMLSNTFSMLLSQSINSIWTYSFYITSMNFSTFSTSWSRSILNFSFFWLIISYKFIWSSSSSPTSSFIILSISFSNSTKSIWEFSSVFSDIFYYISSYFLSALYLSFFNFLSYINLLYSASISF